ncbi:MULTISPECIES: HEAT repeat domain-containing protein [unclassified Paenibacillus]|uniref:HEAT repeat domain-containing protein n=1 Tax=unclassified Paenibacillus TaxID=185978 RepID=UPI0024B9EEB0|nr:MULTISPECIES: HEAT repeat domain-containing protein [unclassified Paenibacillus]
MNKQEARELLRCHSFTHDDLDHPKMTNGFFLLQLAQQSSEDELIRMEALKVIGLYTDGNQQPTILRGICELLVTPDEDDDVQIAALQTLAWMPCSEAELGLALKLIHSDAYILVKEAAFALLCSHKHLPFAQHALKQLLQHEEFGVSAKRELSR